MVFQMIEFGVFGMFDDEHAAFVQQFPFKNQNNQFFKSLLVYAIRRIGENHVVVSAVFFQEFKHIAFDGGNIELKFLGGFFDEVHAAEIRVDAGQVVTAARSEFVTDVPCARKQIQHLELRKIEMVVQDIEQCFLAHVGRGAHRQVFGCSDPPSFIFS